jgi:hypothetical protein
VSLPPQGEEPAIKIKLNLIHVSLPPQGDGPAIKIKLNLIHVSLPPQGEGKEGGICKPPIIFARKRTEE